MRLGNRLMTLVPINYEFFAERSGDSFQIDLGAGNWIDIRLTTVERLNAQPKLPEGPTGRQSFSLIFRAPLNQSFFQKIYRIQHSDLGELDLFLVPIGPDQEGMLLQAIFNFI